MLGSSTWPWTWRLPAVQKVEVVSAPVRCGILLARIRRSGIEFRVV